MSNMSFTVLFFHSTFAHTHTHTHTHTQTTDLCQEKTEAVSRCETGELALRYCRKGIKEVRKLQPSLELRFGLRKNQINVCINTQTMKIAEFLPH
jgi:hypothetical protein